jgi:hypothetical protein
MHPLMREGDVLEAAPYGSAAIAPGDVIAFQAPAGTGIVVHRVTGTRGGEIRTRGDNVARADPWVLQPKDVHGKIVALRRGVTRSTVRGGASGRVIAGANRIRLAMVRLLMPILGPHYRLLARSGLCRRLLPRRLRPRLVEFRSNGAVHRRLMIGGRVAGWQSGSAPWSFPFPFALFVNALDIEPAAPAFEMQLLMRSGAAFFDRNADGTVLACLCTCVAWESIPRLDACSGTTSILLHGLRRHAWRAVPDNVRATLRKRGMEAAGRNLQLLHELTRICRLLHGQGIRFAPIKGPALAAAAYGDACLRAPGDLDFLVDPRDIRRARALLEEDGYAMDLDLPARAEESFLRAQGELKLRKEERGITVELLTGVAPRHFCPPLPHAKLWDARRGQCVGTESLNLLAPEDHLLLVCIHGGKHLWDRLLWILDVAGLCQNVDEAGWRRVFTLARSIGAERMLRLGLELASRVVPSVEDYLPPPALRRNPRVVRLATRLLARYKAGTPAAPRQVEQLLLHLAMHERLRDRVRYLTLLALAPSYSDWITFQLPARLAWLYPILRPFRLLLGSLRRKPAASP